MTADRTIVGASDVLKYVMYRVEQVAATSASVLLLGETGTGKELIARAIHNESPRRHKKFVVVNCGALPPTLIESELF
ncbi:MAG TPA: sigma 54-interacting transcriptional regulator, partial [Vicinamibacterales bacterium]|nr:sigma 54-interacting transcriptional regulator [Vicinamibacterales bacterium]